MAISRNTSIMVCYTLMNDRILLMIYRICFIGGAADLSSHNISDLFLKSQYMYKMCRDDVHCMYAQLLHALRVSLCKI